MTVAEYQFTDTTGKTVMVKEMREIPAYQVGFTMNKAADDDLDELASRTYIYGTGGERDSYKLHEANIVAILEARFDLTRLKTVVVPR